MILVSVLSSNFGLGRGLGLGLDNHSNIVIVMSQDAIMAGVDTTGTTAAFFLLDLAKNPDKQDILHKEMADIIGIAKITESGIKKMKYLKACLHESQRLKNATYGMSRITQTDMVLEGYQVPKGTNVRSFYLQK